MVNREEVYKAIDIERDYQDKRFPIVNGFSASPEGFLLVIEELLTQARASVTQGKLPPLGTGAEIQQFIRKIGATAVRSMEQHGVPAR